MRFQCLKDWLHWQEGLHSSSMDLSLDRVSQVWQRLGAPEIAKKVITVAGTNGKGSCVALSEAILLAHGYEVASFTSPHLLHYNERIRFNAKAVEDEELINAFDAIDQARGSITLTYFEFGALAAFWLMSRRKIDFALLEVGLGGRLDAVNIIDADAVVFTTIALDHTHILGKSLSLIAKEKAGVLRHGQPVAFAMEKPQAVLYEEAVRHRGDCIIFGRDVHYCKQDGLYWFGGLKTPIQLSNAAFSKLPGEHQKVHLSVLLGLLDRFISLNPQRVGKALSAFTHPGRLQLLAESPDVLFDVAHNPSSTRVLADYLRMHPVAGKNYALCAILKDKDQRGILALMVPHIDYWLLCSLDGKRGSNWQHLYDLLLQLGVEQKNIYGFSKVSEACEYAFPRLRSEDRLCVFGSFVTVSLAFNWYQHGKQN